MYHITDPASSFMETRPPVTTRQSSKLGKDLNRVPTSSIRIGQNDGEYMFSKKYKEHGKNDVHVLSVFYVLESIVYWMTFSCIGLRIFSHPRCSSYCECHYYFC